MRTEDALGRWDGEEFRAVLPDTDGDGALVIAERLRARVAEQAVTGSQPTLTVTIGAAVWATGGPEDLVSRADAALYAGKAAGRDNVQLNVDPGPEVVSSDDDSELLTATRRPTLTPRGARPFGQ